VEVALEVRLGAARPKDEQCEPTAHAEVHTATIPRGLPAATACERPITPLRMPPGGSDGPDRRGRDFRWPPTDPARRDRGRDS
jgi:hypothetical protein